MKTTLLFLFIIMSTNAQSQEGKASTTKTTFNRETTITSTINAQAEEVWSVITDAKRYTEWNSTIISFEGKIEPEGKIKLVSTLDPKRTFKLRVKEYDPCSKLVWGDGKGNRVFTLSENGSATIITMTEKIGGLMFPMYAKYIPPFDESFEQFVSDLKQEVEK